MSDDRDDLAALESELADDEQLRCPVCRLEQPRSQTTCGRCGADLQILAGVLGEAAERRLALYQCLLGGDTVTALDHLDRIRQLTGSTMELAVLRRLIRHGTVPIEVAERFITGQELALGDEADPGTVYEAALTGGNELRPPVESAEQAAFAALLERHLTPPAEQPPESEDQDEPEPEPTAEPAPPPSPEAVPEPGDAAGPGVPRGWLLPLVAVVLALLLGIGAGRLGARRGQDQPATSAATMRWRMAPLEGVSETPAVVQPNAEPDADAGR